MKYSPADVAEALHLPPPTPQQAAIIGADLAPMLVVAGAGSGKTETMAARVLWLLANELVRPEEVLGLTFTRKAAGELGQRLRGRLAALRGAGLVTGELAAEPTVSTYHAYAARLVAEHGLRAGLEPATRLLGPAARWQVASSTVATYDGDMSAVDGELSTVTKHVLRLADELAEHTANVSDVARFSGELASFVAELPPGPRQRVARNDAARSIENAQRARLQLLPLVSAFAQRKKDLGAMDFADQMALAAALARDFPEVGAAERRRYRIVLLDEYQDTSVAQLVMLRAIFADGFPVVAVGDPNQSIYGWRGASATNLTRFPTDFPASDGEPATVRPLSISWRNAGRILQLANATSAPLRQTGAIEVPELTSRPAAANSGRVVVSRHLTLHDEARHLAELLAPMWRQERPPSTAVLVRKRDQMDVIAGELRAHGVPVEIVGLGGLLATPEITDLVAALTVIADPVAGWALLRLLTGPRIRLGPRDLDALSQRARDIARRATWGDAAPEAASAAQLDASIIEALDDLGDPRAYSPAGFRRMRRLASELRSLRARFADPIGDIVAETERVLGLDVEVMVRRGRVGRAHLDAFADVVAEFCSNAPSPTLAGLLAYLRAAEDEEYGLEPGEIMVSREAVQIVTAHAAKGLEWDVVAVAGLAGGSFPARSTSRPLWTTRPEVLPFGVRGDGADLPALAVAGVTQQAELKSVLRDMESEWDARELCEERRLAYVAFTRARHTLLISGFWFDSATKPRPPSPFLEEAHAWADGDGVGPWEQRPGDDAPNPLNEHVRTAQWPSGLGEETTAQLAAAADLVRAAMTDGETAFVDSKESVAAAAGWHAEARLLLAEAAAGDPPVRLPEQLSVSALVALRRDPAELARVIRRPMPRPPAPQARIGTEFHTWLERRFDAQTLFDFNEMPGAGDEGARPDADLSGLRAAFEASEWANRTPVAVEVGFATTIEGIVVRGRIDAVFANGDGFEVVDWKTGVRPTGAAAQAAAVQLAAYRLAWAELAAVPVSQVSAAFHYVAVDHTERPVDLLDGGGLRQLLSSLATV